MLDLTTVPDGEYPIELSSLFQDKSRDEGHETIAVRYGFIPDSMDLKSSLTLYHREDGYFIEANQVDNAGGKVIFEGKQQKQRNAHNIASESFFLTIKPEDKRATLGRVDKIIRANKSSDFSKHKRIIELMNKRTLQENELKEVNGESNRTLGFTKEHAKSKPESGAIAIPKVNRISRVASKRPPTSGDSSNNDKSIITESDFDDLEGDEDGKMETETSMKLSEPYSNLTINDTLEKDVPGASAHRDTMHTKKALRANKTPRNYPHQNKESETVRAEKEDVDDDFQDLEDQLQEVLEDDDDSDMDESYGKSKPITIHIQSERSREQPESKMGFPNERVRTRKPTSLRDLVNRMDTREEDQVSEEE